MTDSYAYFSAEKINGQFHGVVNMTRDAYIDAGNPVQGANHGRLSLYISLCVAITGIHITTVQPSSFWIPSEANLLFTTPSPS